MDARPTRNRNWQIAGGVLPIGERTLVMGILNVTPDSFSDGSLFLAPDSALKHAEQMITEGADIIDVGGESTRPGASAVSTEEEISRVLPIIRILAKSSSVPISIDTTKAKVARAALEAGAAIVNDVSGLRFDDHIADEVARMRAGLVLMHSRGSAEAMHRQAPVDDVFENVVNGLRRSIATATEKQVAPECLAIDPGIGFGKTLKQNVALVAKLDRLREALPEFPILIGTSNKSFIGKLLAGASASERLHGTMASITAAILHGADIVRVHDVAATVDTVRVTDAIRRQRFS